MREGDAAEDFELSDHNGDMVSLKSFRDTKNVVLCFYPKNHLFGCPSKKVYRMAESIVSAYPQIASTDSVLFAVSCDTVESQKKFVTQYGIPYAHLSDPAKDTCKAYAGLNFVGLPRRATFVIDKKGTIRKIFEDIAVERHGEELVSFLRSMNGA